MFSKCSPHLVCYIRKDRAEISVFGRSLRPNCTLCVMLNTQYFLNDKRNYLKFSLAVQTETHTKKNQISRIRFINIALNYLFFCADYKKTKPIWMRQTKQIEFCLSEQSMFICVMYAAPCLHVFLFFLVFACVSISAQVTWSACNGSVETHSFRSIRILSVERMMKVSLSDIYDWPGRAAVAAALISLFFSCLLSNLSLVFLSLSRFTLSPLCIWIVSLPVFSFIPLALCSLFEW